MGGSGYVGEDGFYGEVEEASEAESEGERRIVSAGFDGVDGLTGDFEAVGEILLRPGAFGAEDAEAIIHRRLRSSGAAEGRRDRRRAKRE